MGISCAVLERRATENYLTDAAVKAEKGERYTALGHFESLKKRPQFGWAKSENWRIAARMVWNDLKDTDLGRFLVSL